jgi:hypothetical protein
VRVVVDRLQVVLFQLFPSRNNSVRLLEENTREKKAYYIEILHITHFYCVISSRCHSKVCNIISACIGDGGRLQPAIVVPRTAADMPSVINDFIVVHRCLAGHDEIDSHMFPREFL